jgi:hypothetical protein
MNLPSVILLTGEKQNGKDTIALHLKNKYKYIPIALADIIKQICVLIFGFSEEQCYGSLKEKEDEFWKITPRHAFQFIGTELFRKQAHKFIPNIEENIWVKCLYNKINNLLKVDPEAKIVVTDIRFPSELEELNKLTKNTFSIRVIRPLVINTDNHESEKYIKTLKVNSEVINSSTVDELYSQVDKLLNDNFKDN